MIYYGRVWYGTECLTSTILGVGASRHCSAMLLGRRMGATTTTWATLTTPTTPDNTGNRDKMDSIENTNNSEKTFTTNNSDIKENKGRKHNIAD